MKQLIRILLIFIFITIDILAQSLWLVDYGYDVQYDRWVENLDVDSLKSIIINNNWEQSPLVYKGAVMRLYYFHKDTEAQFLLNNLNTEIDSTATPLWAIDLEWDKFYIDAYILGLLGSPVAIEKMVVIANDDNNYHKLYAIGHLAEVGVYNHYDFIKTEYYSDNKDPYIQFLLGLYSRNESYQDEIKSILRNEVYNSKNYFEVIASARNLGFILGADVEILDEFFRNSTGKERYDYFFHLSVLDKDGQPERSMFALQNEPNDTFRVEYLPSPDMVLSWRDISKRYLEPKFVNFLNELNISNPNSLTYQRKEFFQLAFVPVPPDSEIPAIDILDNINNYIDSTYAYSWLGDQQFKNELKFIVLSAKTNLQNGDSIACARDVKSFQDNVNEVYKDSLNPDPRFVTLEGWKFLYYNAQYILDMLPEPSANPNLLVKLTNSEGIQIPASSVKYYEGSWKDAVDNGDGTFTVITTKPTVSVRMFYEYASQTVNNIPAQNNTYAFQTVNASVELRNSSGNLIDEGMVQYYAGVWRSFGTTVNGVATKELLPINYSFRMSYEYGSIDKRQDISINPIVVFQTVNAAVELRNSSGNLIDEGTVQYYAGAWRNFGITLNGIANKELLPKNYSFRMTYEYGSIDKQQDLSINPTVIFQTVNAVVELRNSSGNLIDEGTVQYYAGAWRNFGITINGVANKELLPKNYSFRMTYEFVSNDKQQDLSTNSTVAFSTVLCTLKVNDASNQPLEGANTKYYSGAWRDIGLTNADGIISKELLPKNLSFRTIYGNESQDKQQDISTNNLVEFILNVNE